MNAINEVGRAVVELPAASTIYSSPMYLAIAFDTADNLVSPTLLSRSGKSLGYQAAYELIGYCLCGDRAQLTVDHQLLVNAEPVAPEAYLQLWRAAIKDACTPSGLLRLHGLRAIARITGPVERIPHCTSSWTTAPFESLARSKYAKDMAIVDGQFELRIDLCDRDAPRDAYYISEMVSNGCRDQKDTWSAAIHLEGALVLPATGVPFAVSGNLVEA